MKTIYEMMESKKQGEMFDIETYKKVKYLLEPFEGKRFYKKTIEAMEKSLLENLENVESVDIESVHSWTELDIKFKGKDYRFILMLWYSSEATGLMTSKFLDERNTWVSIGSHERLNKIKKEMKQTKLIQKFERLDEILNELETLLPDIRKSEVDYTFRKSRDEKIKEIVRSLGGRID